MLCVDKKNVYYFFHFIIREWNKLDLQLRNGKSFKKIRMNLPKLGRLKLKLY